MSSSFPEIGKESSCLTTPGPYLRLGQVIGHYEVKTATTVDELRRVFQLRYRVFFREFAGTQIEDSENDLDIEAHDELCDHLIVKDLRSAEVVACYRLLCSQRKPRDRKFYSESEFVIDEFVRSPEPKLELGRACVHKDYRRGTVILLLWRGLVEYARICGARYLFGCSSISHDQFSFIPEILAELEQRDKFIKEWPVDVLAEYALDPHTFAHVSERQVRAQTSLMELYLNAGARVGRQPAHDRGFNCVDLFTVLDFAELPAMFKRGLSD